MTAGDHDDALSLLGWPPDLVARLHAELEARNPMSSVVDGGADPNLRAALDRMRRASRVPAIGQLGELLGVAYRATLTVDEGRPTTFRLVFLDPESEAGRWPTVALEDPPALSVAALRQIAPAGNADSTYLAVADDHGTLRIWGIVKVPGAEVGNSRPPGIVIRGLGAGRLTVTTAHDEVLELGPNGAVLLPATRLGRFDFRRIIDGALGLAGDPVSAESLVMLQIARAVRDHGHGGTLLVVDRCGPDGHGLMVKFPLDRGTERSLAERWADNVARNGESQLGAAWQRHSDSPSLDLQRDLFARRAYEDAVALVAGLSEVDGAVVMTSDLTILGFGAFVDLSNDRGRPTVTEVDGFDQMRRRPVPRSSLGGARHQSALAFVEQFPGRSIAFVASQDGMLTLVGRAPDGELIAIRPVLPNLR